MTGMHKPNTVTPAQAGAQCPSATHKPAEVLDYLSPSRRRESSAYRLHTCPPKYWITAFAVMTGMYKPNAVTPAQAGAAR